jgi:hypothetical protein
MNFRPMKRSSRHANSTATSDHGVEGLEEPLVDFYPGQHELHPDVATKATQLGDDDHLVAIYTWD